MVSRLVHVPFSKFEENGHADSMDSLVVSEHEELLPIRVELDGAALAIKGHRC